METEVPVRKRAPREPSESTKERVDRLERTLDDALDALAGVSQAGKWVREQHPRVTDAEDDQ